MQQCEQHGGQQQGHPALGPGPQVTEQTRPEDQFLADGGDQDGDGDQGDFQPEGIGVAQQFDRVLGFDRVVDEPEQELPQEADGGQHRQGDQESDHAGAQRLGQGEHQAGLLPGEGNPIDRHAEQHAPVEPRRAEDELMRRVTRVKLEIKSGTVFAGQATKDHEPEKQEKITQGNVPRGQLRGFRAAGRAQTLAPQQHEAAEEEHELDREDGGRGRRRHCDQVRRKTPVRATPAFVKIDPGFFNREWTRINANPDWVLKSAGLDAR